MACQLVETETNLCRLARSVSIADLVLKSHAHKITSSPNDLAAANIVKIIECKFKIQGQDIQVAQMNSCAALRYVVDVASEHAALLVKKQQRILRDRCSGDGSSFGQRSRRMRCCFLTSSAACSLATS